MSKPSFVVRGTLIAISSVALVGALALGQGWLRPLRAQGGPATSAVATSEPRPSVLPNLPRTITVVGEGSVKIKPDLAKANIGVETIGDTVKATTGQAATTMDAVMAALKKQGIADKDIQTSGYSLWVERDRGPEGRLAEKLTYHVINNVSVTIRDLNKVGTVLDAAIEAGANSIHGVSFSIAEPQQLEAQAREKAIEVALSKAREIARLNGVTVGPVLSISEIIGAGGGYYDSNFDRLGVERMGLGGGGGPVNPGELELSLKLQVVYAIQ